MEMYVIIGGAIIGTLVLLGSILAFVNKNYIKIPPNMAAVIFGRKHFATIKDETGNVIKVEKGYRVVNGGGVFKIPILEQIEFMNLSNRMLNVKVENAPNKDGVMTTVEGVANVKFASEMNLLQVAVERFLGRDDQEIDKIILQNLEGHLRAVVGKMTMEALIGDKTELNKAVLEEANDDFNKMGINIDFLNIQDIRDNDNYIKNLGRKRAAEIKRDADIGTAEAEKDAIIKTTTAERIGIAEANNNEMLIAESNKERDVKVAEMKAIRDKENEIANQAGPLSQAQALRAVVEAEAETAAAKERASILVQEQRALKEAKRYEAEVVVPARAEKEAKVIDAEAQRDIQIVEAAGIREAAIVTAEGESKAIVMKKTAEAEGEAIFIKKKGEAEGEAIYAKLSAEAKGVAEKAEAYAKLDQTGKFLEILNSLQTLGPNVIKEFAGVMGAASAHLGNVKDVKIIDFGGNGKDGSGSVSNYGSVPIEILNKLFHGLSGSGMDMSKLLNFLGIDASQLSNVTELSNVDEDKPKKPKKQ